MPRVTIGIPCYNRATFLPEAIDSCLAQDYDDFEVLVVDDGSTDADVAVVLDRYVDHPRFRLVRHERNSGAAAAKNTIIREARGELVIPSMGDDDVSLPGRIARQVEVFDRHPDAGVVHGDALIIDETGRQIGVYPSAELTRRQLVRAFFRFQNPIVDPTAVIHARVLEEIGDYDLEYPPSEDFDLWLRIVERFEFRYTPGGPLVKYRRHGAQASGDDAAAMAKQTRVVTKMLRRDLAKHDLRELVPELDWSVIPRGDAERRALEVLARDLESRRHLPLAELGAELRAEAAARRASPAPAPNGRRIVMTAFGWNESGGGTLLPRLVGKELVRRGWDVTVFYAGVGAIEGAAPYAVRESSDDGVRLVGVFNRPHGLLDLGHPDREVDDPPIASAFAELLDRARPDVVHMHNLHNLGAALIDEAAARGIPTYFSPHNHWLLCPRSYLMRENGSLCGGPGNRGRDCAACVGSSDAIGYEHRLSEIRGRVARGVDVVLAMSEAVKRALVATGYPAGAIDVVRQTVPSVGEVWERLGRKRTPGRAGDGLTVGFFGSAYGIKGPQLLMEAVRRAGVDVRMQVHGDMPAAMAKALDGAELCGPYTHSELPERLAGVDVAVVPSMVRETDGLVAAECLAGRVPVLAARMGGLTERVRDGVDGLLFDGRDPIGLARLLERVAGEPGLLERLQEGIEAPGAFSDYVDELEAYYRGERPSAARPEARPATVTWVGDHTLPTSLSIVNQRVGERLRGSFELKRVERGGASHDAPLSHVAEVEVRHQWPPDLRPATSGRLAVIQPWEFGSVPSRWVADIEANVDELWVPSEFVRSMYVGSGVAPERVHVVPNGVDLEVFKPAGPARELDAPGTRFLFVGGLIPRKGPDLLLDAWLQAFAGRDDVTLVAKDFGAGGVYARGDREGLRAHAESGALPRVVLLDDELSTEEMAALYRACDVLVHPYRGEGFGMPVLEAMACGLPVAVTAGGPTDEFCPDDACWRIPSARRPFPERRVGDMETAGTPWMLEPDIGALTALLRSIAGDAEGRAARGAAGAEAARALSWDTVAAQYRARIEALAAQRPAPAAAASGGAPAPAAAVSGGAPSPAASVSGRPLDLPMLARPRAFVPEEQVDLRVLAAPAWRAEDTGLAELLAAWREAAPAGTSACLYLLVASRADGTPEELLQRTADMAASAGIDLDGAADITLLAPPAGADVHAAMDAYVALPGAAPGHARAARALIEPVAAELASLIATPRAA